MDIHKAMAKFNLIFSLLLLLVFQQVYSSLPASDNDISSPKNNKIEASFVANDSFSGVWGDVPGGRINLNVSLSVTDCDLGLSKSKDICSGLKYSISKNNLKFVIAQSSVFTRYSAVYIPIYLQTASFLL
jgi:hypothetical protein